MNKIYVLVSKITLTPRKTFSPFERELNSSINEEKLLSLIKNFASGVFDTLYYIIMYCIILIQIYCIILYCISTVL